MNVPITQSEAWQKLQNDLKVESFIEKNNDFQYLALLNHTPTGNYLYLPYGPIADSANSFNDALDSLKTLAEKHECIFIRIEPMNQSLEKHLPKSAVKTKDLNPKETWLLDLNGTDEELNDKLPSRLLRYYKNHEKNGITIEQSKNEEDIKILLNLQKALANQKHINTFSEEYLKTELKQPFATLYIVRFDNSETNQQEIVAAGLVFDHEGTRYNLQGAQSEQGRKLHATGILTIQLILDAKTKGLKTFDFWGIAPENAPKDHPWQGFTAFKKTFKGYEKDYVGTYDIVLKPAKYRLYKSLRKINRLRKH